MKPLLHRRQDIQITVSLWIISITWSSTPTTPTSNTKPWRLLLVDGHITHEYPDFVIGANEHHITFHYFPSQKRYGETLEKVIVQLSYAHLVESEHQFFQARLLGDQKRRTSSRKSLHKGGVISVAQARRKREERVQKEKDSAIQKTEFTIQQQVNSANKKLRARGAKARKEEKERKKLVQYLKSRGQPLLIGGEISIRDPEKNPTEAERVALLPHISLVEKLNELRPPEVSVLGQVETKVGEEEKRAEVVFTTEALEEAPDEPAEGWEAIDSEPVSDEIESIEDSTDAASRSSIARNADIYRILDRAEVGYVPVQKQIVINRNW